MISLTLQKSGLLWVNPDWIVKITTGGQHSIVHILEGYEIRCTTVLETPEEIAKKIK